MIIRTWKARTTRDMEANYFNRVRNVVLPHLKTFHGYSGAHFAKRELADDLEILVITFWESEAALKAFTGEESEESYMPPEVAETLVSFDHNSDHFEGVIHDV